ncbi:MAG: acetylglutamate kinase [Rhodobacteraceae bacterium]|nr:acetylglutamate kinase [Paracoccaceae bacterium]MCY4328328.1 acetylglutamate kinase [Paracoccaceae bacterium]
MKSNQTDTARTLSEALPYLQRYEGATVVIKIGGNTISDNTILPAFARDITLMKQVGVNPVVVHGGGPEISQLLSRLGIESEFVDGKRVSGSDTVEIAEMVLAGSLNKRIVQAINSQGGQAVGISGKDASLMACTQTDPKLGLVGVPTRINVQLLQVLSAHQFIPVIAPIGVGSNGTTLNVNGDTAAGAIASGLKADRLLLLTDVDGVMDADGQLLTQLSADDISELRENGTLKGGMIPKTETAIAALREGVRAAVILNGRIPNAVLLELFTDLGAGSLIRL